MNANRKRFDEPKEVIEETPLQKLIKRAAVKNPQKGNSPAERLEQPNLKVDIPQTYSRVKQGNSTAQSFDKEEDRLKAMFKSPPLSTIGKSMDR